jgi:hypothetical protein
VAPATATGDPALPDSQHSQSPHRDRRDGAFKVPSLRNVELFGHPQLFVPNGVKMQGGRPLVTDEGVARDVFLEIPAVGRKGGPLPAGFLE